MNQRQPSEATCRALCEAISVQEGIAHYLSPNAEKALAAYRAESTPLRTESVVALDALLTLRLYHCPPGGLISGNQSRDLHEKLKALAAEPTAPEPAREGEAAPACKLCGKPMQELVHFGGPPVGWTCHCSIATNPLTDHDSDMRDPEACGCEQAEALKDQLQECRRLLGHVQSTVAGLAKLLETLPG